MESPLKPEVQAARRSETRMAFSDSKNHSSEEIGFSTFSGTFEGAFLRICDRSILRAHATQNDFAVSWAELDCTRRWPKCSSIGSSVSLWWPWHHGSPSGLLLKHTDKTPKDTCWRLRTVSGAKNNAPFGKPLREASRSANIRKMSKRAKPQSAFCTLFWISIVRWLDGASKNTVVTGVTVTDFIVIKVAGFQAYRIEPISWKHLPDFIWLPILVISIEQFKNQYRNNRVDHCRITKDFFGYHSHSEEEVKLYAATLQCSVPPPSSWWSTLSETMVSPPDLRPHPW